jgi:hypothetical protein
MIKEINCFCCRVIKEIKLLLLPCAQNNQLISLLPCDQINQLLLLPYDLVSVLPFFGGIFV